MRPKFSLRTLFIVTVVLGTSLGIYLSGPSGDIVELSADNFDELVISSDRAVVVAFTADW